MTGHRHPFALAFVVAIAAPLAAQVPAGAIPPVAIPATNRFVDFHRDLARRDVVVVVGTLGKTKEGKRERLADGKLGSAGSVAAVSGTQYFKVPVQASVQPRAVFAGKADKLTIAFDVQLARLPDGKEQRQSTTGTAAPMDEGMLALFVLAPREKQKSLELLHVIPFDKAVDTGPDAEATFVDTMSDFHAVNRRVQDLEVAIDRLEKAPDAPARAEALTALKELVAHPLSLRRAQNEALLGQHVMPLEQRAKKRIEDAEAPKPPAGEGTGK